jgi:hypothetical protein
MNLESLSDSELYTRAKEYGLNARVWRRRFAGLLPEVLRRELHRRRGYASIYEFAFKLAGMSNASVDKVLHLAEKLADKPVLREQLVSGEQGWSKIEKVAYIATPETDKEWAEKVETMSVHSLEAFVQVTRDFTKNESGGKFTHVSEPSHKFRNEQWGNMSFPVSPEIEKQLRLKKYQLEKEKGVTLTYNEVLQILMAGGAPQEAQVVVQVCPECAARKAAEAAGRAIPVSVRRLLQATYHGYCGFPTCARPATSLHHTKRYSLEQGHDARHIVPLCKEHERLVHQGLIENEEAPPREWRVRERPDPARSKFSIDQKVQSFRKEPILQVTPSG